MYTCTFCVWEECAIATRKDVAKLADVSEATVSRVFNNVGPLREQTRLKVLQAAEQLNYTPNALAQSLVRRKSGNVGVVLPLLPKVHLFSSYYFSEILSGIGQTASERGYDTLLLYDRPDDAPNYLRHIHTRKVDALILLGRRDTPSDRAAVSALVEQQLPVCLIGQRYEHLPVKTVDADHVNGSCALVSHLIALGRRRVAFINGPLHYSNSADRLLGYKLALERHGIPYDPSLVLEGNFSRKSGYGLANTIARLAGRIDAVFAANDRMAVGLVRGLQSIGFPPGAGLVVAGYDNSELAQLGDPPLTSVEVPLFQMGQLAANKLLDQVLGDDGEAQPFYERLPTRLIVRQ